MLIHADVDMRGAHRRGVKLDRSRLGWINRRSRQTTQREDDAA